MDDDNNPATQIEDENKANNKKGKYSGTEVNEAGPSTSDYKGTRDPENNKFEYEPAPSKRNRIARKLVQKMRHIIYEYSVKTGEQVTGVFIDKPNAPNKDYKIYGTKALVSVVDNLKCSIDQKYKKSLNDEKESPSNCAKPKLPQLMIDGVVTKLEYFTQSQLRKFIPYLIKYSTGRHYTGWNNSSLRPEWWPKDLEWFNVRYDVRSIEQKAKEKWTNTLQRIIIECYKFYGYEAMLDGREILKSLEMEQENPNNCVASTPSTSTNQDAEEMEETIVVENVPMFHGFQIMNDTPVLELTENSSNLHNVMYLLQTVGPSTSLLHPIQVMPVQTINLEDTNSVSNSNDLKDTLKQTSNETTVIQLNDDMEMEVSNGIFHSTNTTSLSSVSVSASASANVVQVDF